MNGRRCPGIIRPLAAMALCGAIGLGIVACGSAPTAPTRPPTSVATIESVVTTFRGALVESDPIVIASPEVLNVEIRVALQMPSDAKMTMYLCVMETASSIGVGTCVAVSTTVADVQGRGNVLGMGIRTLQTDGLSRQTAYVYVGITEGAFPWHLTGASPPRVGDTFGSNRVLATVQVARAVTFR